MDQEIVEGFRLSPQQRHLWRTQALVGATPFRSRALVRVDAALDAGRLQAAAHELVAGNEVLRSTFGKLPGVALPVQVIADELAPRYTQLEGDADTAREAFTTLSSTDLDLQSGPLFDVTLIAEAEATSWLVLGLPAMCCDGAGLTSLIEQLLRAYAGTAPVVADDDEGPLQYADLSEWQNELLESDESTAEIEAWRARGATGQPTFDLGFLTRRTSTSFDPAVVEVPLAEPTQQAALELAGRLGVPVERVHLAAWQVLLARMSGQTELLLGLGCDGRTHDELRGAVGLFGRDLPLACTHDADESFAALVASVHQAVDASFETQEYASWEHVTGGEHGYFPVTFETTARGTLEVVGAPAASLIELRARSQRFELRLISTGSGALELEFDRAALVADEVEALAGRLAVLLADATARPDARVGELSLMDDSERATAAAGLRGPDEPVPAVCIHDLIAEAAAQNAEAPAAIDADGTLTYAELIVRANRLANHLVAQGVGPGVRVGICLERSTEMFVAIVGVLTAGGAYVPIDPSYPSERRAFMARDSKVPVVVTRSEQTAEDADFGGAQVLRLDTEADAIASAGDGRPQSGVGPDDLAYVIYTSGSTGTPKGVEILHRNLVHSTRARYRFYDDLPTRYLLLSSFAFDSSVTGIFWTLTQGGALVLPRPGEEKEVARLGELIERHGVTTTLALPSLFGLILEHVAPERLATLRTVIVAGEACPRDLAARSAERLSNARLFNEYGPTEATVWCTACECVDLDPSRPVPIGRPIANTVVRLLDARGEPVPVGAPGELHVGGPGVARGYLDRPELTAERFVPDPYAEGGGRLYRTGDLARVLPSGQLEFLGRIDQQVKIRGYRVELGEIEDAISAAPGVREVVVAARADASGDARLVAYVVGASDVEAIIAGLRARLPEYMVPAAFVTLDDLPRTPNGKVDRKALPEPDGGRPELSTEYVAPEGPVEQAVAQIWAEVLGVDPVGVQDDFFELGGHSIMAVRLLARMNEFLGVDVSLRTLFDAPSVRGLVAALGSDPEQAARLTKAAELLAQIASLSEDELNTALDERGGA